MIYLPLEALDALKSWDERTRALERDQGIIVRKVFHRHGNPDDLRDAATQVAAARDKGAKPELRES